MVLLNKQNKHNQASQHHSLRSLDLALLRVARSTSSLNAGNQHIYSIDNLITVLFK